MKASDVRQLHSESFQQASAYSGSDEIMNNLNKMNEKIKINNPENSKWWGKSLWWVQNMQGFWRILSISLCGCVCIKIHNPVHNNLYYLRTLRVYRPSDIPHIGSIMSSVYECALELHSWEHRKIIYVNRMNPAIFYAFCRNVFFSIPCTTESCLSLSRLKAGWLNLFTEHWKNLFKET